MYSYIRLLNRVCSQSFVIQNTAISLINYYSYTYTPFGSKTSHNEKWRTY